MRRRCLWMFELGLVGAWAQPHTDAVAVALPALKLPANPSTEDLCRARLFEEPLVPIGGLPSADENAGLANALAQYSRRAAHDDYTTLTQFLTNHPTSPWSAALLTLLGLE